MEKWQVLFLLVPSSEGCPNIEVCPNIVKTHNILSQNPNLGQIALFSQSLGEISWSVGEHLFVDLVFF